MQGVSAGSWLRFLAGTGWGVLSGKGHRFAAGYMPRVVTGMAGWRARDGAFRGGVRFGFYGGFLC